MNDRLSAQYWLHEKELTAYSSDAVRDRRRRAMELFEAKGFPTQRDEDWKYVSLKPVLSPHYALNSPCAALEDEHLEYADIKRFLVNELDAYRVVFLNGRYTSWLSDTTHQGFDVCTLSSAWKKYPETIERYFAQLTEDLGPLAQLNTALAWDGIYVVVPDNVVVDRPIQLLSFTSGAEPRAIQVRNLVVLGVNSQVEIIERHQSLSDQPTWTNSVDEAYLAEGAHLRWVKLQHDGPLASMTQHTRIQQDRSSRSQVHTISTGGRFIRNNLDIVLNGPGAEARMLGLTLGKGKQLVDHHTLVDHRAPNCISHENYKGIYDEGSKGVFNGRIYVHREAQKTDAYQQNANLVLHQTAEVNAKPQLEIFADDVRCSHGCTVGQLDEDALFYLRARGIREPEARAMLMLAFAEDALAGIDHPSLNAKLHKLIAGKLGVDLTLDL